MGQYAGIAAAGLQVAGGLASDSAAKGATAADRKAQERLTQMALQSARDSDREDWERTRALWKDAATAMTPFNKSAQLRGTAQYTETPRVDTPGLGFTQNGEGYGG